jgi:peptidoglycan hydrolase-like protein with peptidoglycan-binding domain
MVKNFDDFEKQMNEGGFWDWLRGKKDETKGLSADDKEFYSELEDFANSGKTITVQSKGNMQYSDLVKKIQIGLDFLGFKMPKHGVDGYFGPETANAIANFNAATKSNQPADEALINFESFSEMLDEAQNGRLAANDLETISIPGHGETHHRLNKEAEKDYERMVKAAAKDGVTWQITDSYRNYDQQVQVAKEKGLYNQGGYAAVPGTSNHGWGAAVDLKLDAKAQAWMNANAKKYGFTSIPREPWHWEHKSSLSAAKQSAEEPASSPRISLIDGDLVRRLIVNLKNKGFGQEELSKYATTSGAEVVVGGSVNDDNFYRAILRMLGANETPEKMKFLKAWRQAEGGQADYNPFNTTKNLKVKGIRNYNSAGVKEYPNPAAGLAATVATLKLPHYARLLALLRDDSVTAHQLADCPDLQTWGTGDGVKRVLASGIINPPPIPTA